MIDGLALDLAIQAHVARADSTVAQYKEPWKSFTAWVAQLPIQEDDIYIIQLELVAMYLMYIYQSAQVDEVGQGRISIASSAIACHFPLMR